MVKVEVDVAERFDQNRDGQIDNDELLAAMRAGLMVEGLPMGLGVLFEERTVRLILIPLGTVIVTTIMSCLSGTKYLFVSDTLNCSTCPTPEKAAEGNCILQEDWSAFIARWYLWHLAAATVVAFKVRAYPKPLRWLAPANLLGLWGCIWSGYQQNIALMSPAAASFFVNWHLLMSLVVFILFFCETIMLWWPNRILIGSYFAILFVYLILYVVVESGNGVDTGIPYINDHIEIPAEWVVLGLHLFVVWYKYPTFGNSQWEPWLCCNNCCLACCKALSWKSKAKVEDETPVEKVEAETA